jgi:hypothetical protein
MISTAELQRWGMPARSQTAAPATSEPLHRKVTRQLTTALTAATAGMTAITGSVASTQAWSISAKAPTAARATWENIASALRHPIMSYPAVQEFIQSARLTADIEAIRQIHDVALARFSDLKQVTASYEFSEDFDTHGMDLAEQMRREKSIFATISQNPALRAANAYNILTVV